MIAQQAHFADLDGAWLLGDDPFRGAVLEAGVLHPRDMPGLGIEVNDPALALSLRD